MIYSFDQIKNKVTSIAKSYGVNRVLLFGSYANGTQNLNSDIDLFVDKGKIRGLFELSGFKSELEETFKTKVDVVTTDINNKVFKDNIDKEAILIYELPK